VALPSEAELLRYIAEHEPLQGTRTHFPELTAARLQELLAAAIARAPADPNPAPKPRPVQTSLALDAGPTAAAAATAAAPVTRARVYSDGASRGNPGPAGAGAAIIDAETGKVVELCKKFLGRQTNNVAEYQAAILGLTRARALGIREVELIADSQLLIRQLGGQYKVKHPGIKPLYDEAMALLKTFAKVRLIHVPREMNTLADEMSNRAIDEK
jgi:ribonuclease HI